MYFSFIYTIDIHFFVLTIIVYVYLLVYVYYSLYIFIMIFYNINIIKYKLIQNN